tara:strand:+ start:713 stop:1819 length:1107 start_codon:yes stop_codon:yes gene_type:complete
MEFFDKKKDVIDLKLTRYGKQLLSLGRLEPVYYAFSDDGIIYDRRWVSTGSAPIANPKEDQWLVERRIQEETPRIKTLNSKIGAERTIFNTANLSDYALEKNIIDLFNLGNDWQDIEELEEYKSGKLLLDDDFAESENLMTNMLGSKRYFNDKAPAWNMLFYNGTVSSSFKYYQNKDLFQFVPQINANIVDKGYKVPFGYNNDQIPGHAEWTAGESDDPHHSGDFFVEYGYEEGSYVMEKGYLFLSLEEAHVDFNKENFLLEVFEVTEYQKQGSTEKEEHLKKLFFSQESSAPIGITPDSVENVFSVKIDGEINQSLACMLINKKQAIKTQNIYTSDTFDCGPMSPDDLNNMTSNNPYDLPPVDIEDC